MLTGETKDTIAEGRVVQVTVRKVLPHKAICELESRVTGILTADDYSDMRRPDDLSLELNEGDVLNCMIKNIQTNRHQVYLSYKESEVKGDQYRNTVLDPFYHPDEVCIQSEQEKARKAKELAKKKHFKSRMIVHPRFQNITADEAVEFLSDKEAGESIIHPSYRGPSCLTLTLKVEDGVYAQKDIAESGKDHKDITSLLRLGKTLKIGDDTFEDLDEVMDRYVDPLVTHLKAMLNYRKFRRGTKAEVDDLLRNEKSENPMRIVYCFGISHEHPGTFILFYIKNTNPHHELISLYPKGFKFRKRTFEEIDRLVAYFQKHIDDLPPDSTQSVRSVAAMVPMRSPAGGGWSGSAANGNDGSWRGHGSSDRERSSTPGSRSGAKDYRNGGRDGHPSGAPRPYGGRGGGRDGNRGGGRDGGWDGGRGRGRGRGNNRSSDREDSGFGSSRWNSGPKDDNDGLSSFPGAKTQNSPGREAFPGSWGSGWGSGGDAAGGGNDGWGSGGGKAAGGTDGWGSGGGTATAGTDGWGSGGGTPAGGASGWGSTGGTAGGGSEGWGSGKVNGVTGAGKEWNSSGTKGTAAAQDPGSENAGWGDSSKKNGSAAKEDGNGWGGTGW